MSQLIQVTAVIVNYTPNAMHDSFNEGYFDFYDATEIQILVPKALSGLERSIYHSNKVPQDKLWRTIGQRIDFNIDKAVLVNEITLFDGAVSNCRANVQVKIVEPVESM